MARVRNLGRQHPEKTSETQGRHVGVDIAREAVRQSAASLRWGCVLRNREIRAALERSFDHLVHSSVIDDPVEIDRHRGFIGSHLVAGFSAFGLIPLALAVDASSAGFTATALSILGLEILVALFVSRTGRLAQGYLLSSAILTGLAVWVALYTGGLGSFAVVWFAIAPIEAALSGRRATIAGAAAISGGGFVATAILTATGTAGHALALPGDSTTMSFLACVVALGYASAVAIGIERRERATSLTLARQEQRYRLLAEAMSDLVTCHDPSGDVTFASPAALRLLSVRPADLTADGLFRRVHIGDRPAYLSAISTALHEGAARVEYRLRCGDDQDTDGWIWVESHMRHLADETGTDAVVTVTRDISERKQHEAELEHLRAESEAANLAKTRFLANMSHELRTPLNAIIGFSDILNQELFGRFEFDRQREYSGLIKESGEHLLQVVNDILDLSKIECGSFDVNPEAFRVGPLVDRCRQMMAPQAEKAGIALFSDVEPNLPELVADARACRQIVLNLLSNAVKFSNRGGQVVCSVRRQGRRMAIAVRDNGIGIAEKDLARVGNPFFQAETGYDRKQAGTGLGLSVVKGLVALHGGQVMIDSDLGKGTTVTVLLPLQPSRDAAEPISRVLDVEQIQRVARRA